MQINNNIVLYIFLLGTLIPIQSYGQQQINVSQISGSDSYKNVISTAVPFLGFAPDARSASLGDVGVSTSADFNSVHWNNAKLAFIDKKFGVSFSVTPWLRKLINDMYIGYLSGYYKIGSNQAVAITMKYFDLGTINLTNETGESNGISNPRDFAIDGTYSRKLGNNFGIGVTIRYIYSNLISGFAGNTGVPGQGIAFDLGSYYTTKIQVGNNNSILSAGIHFSNIGTKITYSTPEQADFLPMNMRIGMSYLYELDPYNSLTVILETNKLMVPTPPIRSSTNYDSIISGTENRGVPVLSGLFRSFNDAPRGTAEEFEEVSFSSGIEYWYRDFFAVRFGHHFENINKGDRKYFTLGIGLKYNVLELDVAYLIPQGGRGHPLADTFRFTLGVNFKSTPKQKPENTTTESEQ